MKLYNIIEQTLRQHIEYLNVGNDVSEEDVCYAIRWVMRDNPDIFWFVHQYHFDKENGRVSFRYRCSLERSAIIQESINDVVENDFLINYVRTLPHLEQVTYVYKWLLSYCNYNVNSAYNQNMDSVFVRRNSVCTGYAKAAQYLFKLLGIESRLVFGRLNNDKGNGRHCWNIICIEGCYYHLDVCLGDLNLEYVLEKAGTMTIHRRGDYNYNCFCVSTNEIAKTRTIEDIETLPSCDNVLPMDEIERLSRIEIKVRKGIKGCLLTHIGSSADIFLCTKDKNVVLKKFRGSDTRKCKEEYGYMNCLSGCNHLLQLNAIYSDVNNNILAIEQSVPIVDLFCSHYYHPTLNGVLNMIEDITLGWLECRQLGVLYRDIHVCNIYRSNDGRYKLGDFGSCTYRLKGLRERVGNPWFMSPETYVSGRFDEQSAVYSITAVLYFILNGFRPAFVGDNNEEDALQRKMKGEALPEPASLHFFPKDAAERIMTMLIERGCAFYPSKRIQSCKELLHIIDVLRSNIKSQKIEKRFVQQDTETILDNNNVPNAYIPRENHHGFANGEEIERTAATKDSYNFDRDNNGCSLDCHAQSACQTPAPDDVESYCETMGVDEPTFKEPGKIYPNGKISSETKTFSPIIPGKRSFRNKLIGKKTNEAYSSVFAPAEVKRRSHMLVQVYVHLLEETEKVIALAQESQKDAERRDYIPLQYKLKKGDKVGVALKIYGETLLMSKKNSVVWQGSFTKCSFDYFVQKDIDLDELSCVVLLSVNGLPVGEMRFVTKIVETPRKLNPEIIAHKYSKVFISYSHLDESKVKFLHEGLVLGDVPHFFDRKYLKAGDVYPKVIEEYINSADLFILCWSENASKSRYVRKERLQALKRAFPQVQPEKVAKLRMYPISIEPHAKLPRDMKKNYHFEEM